MRRLSQRPSLVLQVDIERVLHRTRRMVLGAVQCSEVVPVGLDLRAVGHLEPHRLEDRFDALDRQRHRMQPTFAAPPARQRDVQRLGAQLRVEFGLRQRLAPFLQRRLDALLGAIDQRAARLLLVHRQAGQRLQQLGDAPRLAQEARLRVLQFGGRGRARELLLRTVHQLVQFVHVRRSTRKRAGRPEVTACPVGCVPQHDARCGRCGQRLNARGLERTQASWAFTLATMLPKAAGSLTASSASILRSISIAAFFMPAMNWL